MADPVGVDVEMTDAAEGSGPSVFALLQPKREPVASAASKGKFVPKVKARPGARPRAASASVQTETKGGISVNDEPSIPLAVGDIAVASASIDTIAADVAGNIPLLIVRTEPNVSKPEPMYNGPLLKVKAEPQDAPDSKMHLDADLFEELGNEEVKEELSFKEEIAAVNDEEPVESTPGVDRVVREIDVFLTPQVDPETNVRFVSDCCD